MFGTQRNSGCLARTRRSLQKSMIKLGIYQCSFGFDIEQRRRTRADSKRAIPRGENYQNERYELPMNFQ